MGETRAERAEGVAKIRLNCPEKRKNKNAIMIAMFEELGRLAVELGNERSVRSVP